MLYIDRIVLHNFKSFRHASIAFRKNFNCIVGPNGSGKSNVCDSLLFALGESSLRRLRIVSPTQLLNEDVKKGKNEEMRRAYVKVIMGGDANVEIIRYAREDRKMGYRLNGKHTTKQDVVEFLRGHGGDVNETNTIAQGEIVRILNMNSKERREIIDVAAGINEFDKKKEAAERELERVEERLGEAHGMLNERKGFLKELKKEKEDAERYKEFADQAKLLAFSILAAREKALLGELETHRSQLSGASARKESISRELLAIDSDIESLSSERRKLAEELNRHSIETSSANSAIEGIKRELAVSDERLSSSKALREKAEEALAKIAAELEKHSKKSEELRAELESLHKEISESGNYGEIDEGENYADIAEKYSKLSAEISALEEAHSAAAIKAAEAESRMRSLEETLLRYNSEREQLQRKLLESATALKKATEAAALAGKSKEGALNEDAKIASKIAEMRKASDQANEEMVRVREQLAVHGGAGAAIAARLREELGEGFHGRAYELCTYAREFEAAINASAGSRLSYFVVDNAAIASKAIDILKRRDLGRASFIPIEDVVRYEVDKSTKGLKPIIDNIQFDQKYLRVFNFIFSNTYLVGSIAEAKRNGIGKRRYVTIEGDLVENTGVISGGRSRVSKSPMMLESQLASLRSKLSNINEEIVKLENERKLAGARIAKAETDLIRHNAAMDSGRASKSEVDVAIAKLEADAERISRELDGERIKLDGLGKEKDALEKRLIATKAEAQALRAQLGDSSAMKRVGSTGEAAKKAKEARARLEALKVKAAGDEKELELVEARSLALEEERKAQNRAMKELIAEEKELSANRAKLEADRKELEGNMNSKDSFAKELYAKVSDHERQISELGFKSGTLKSEMERLERSIIELSGKISQAEVRIGDIKAEKRSYEDITPLDLPLDQMEQKLGAARAGMERLGSVNMKAPEMYSERSREVEEAEERLRTISMEKTSILDMISEIESKKISVFGEVFDSINANFKRIYKLAYDGEAEMKLENQKNPFSSGLQIIIRENGKTRSVEALSGGEKSFVLIMLIFAIQMRRQMSFYIFDEIDSALDKENSKKLSMLLKRLGESSQFIVVSHNDSLIAYADTVIGVAKHDGESRAVGIEANAGGVEGREL